MGSKATQSHRVQIIPSLLAFVRQVSETCQSSRCSRPGSLYRHRCAPVPIALKGGARSVADPPGTMAAERFKMGIDGPPSPARRACNRNGASRRGHRHPREVKLPTVAGLLAAGALLGPFGLRLATSVEAIEVLAEVGVVLLLFSIGLEFSLVRLRKPADRSRSEASFRWVLLRRPPRASRSRCSSLSGEPYSMGSSRRSRVRLSCCERWPSVGSSTLRTAASSSAR